MTKYPILHTKFGTAKINKKGHYQITSRKEGNGGKLLHRLIFEEFYGEIPEGFDIHHKNGIKTDNCILNLQLMRHGKHSSLHNKDKIISKKTRQKMSESQKGEKNHRWKNYARIIKDGYGRGKKQYQLKFKGKVLKRSINLHFLIEWFNKNYPTEPLHIELNGGCNND